MDLETKEEEEQSRGERKQKSLSSDQKEEIPIQAKEEDLLGG